MPETPETPVPARRLTRRRFLGLGAVAASAAVTAALVDARFFELHWIEVTRRRMPVRGLPPALAGKTLVHMSDLHVGPRVDPAYVIRTFRRVRALQPDLVAFTGDFITNSRTTLAMARRVYDHVPHGRIATVGVLGNHDYGRRWAIPALAAAVETLLRERGVDVIRNDVRTVAGLQIAGLDDLWAEHFNPQPVHAKLDPSRPVITLSHNPDTVDLEPMLSIPGWVLSGHTHGGQVRLPPFPPPVLPVRNRRYAAGEVDLGGGRRLYVTRGVGHLVPVRFGVRPEVAVFTLTPA